MNDNCKKILLIASSHIISYLSYKKFKNEVLESINYEKILNNDGSCVIKRIGIHSDQNQRFFQSISSRCNCLTRRSYLIQCRHEIVLHEKFEYDLFDIRHNYRKECSIITYKRNDKDSNSLLNYDISSQDHNNLNENNNIILT